MTNIIFFGSDRYSTIVLEQLVRSDFKISSVITTPQKPKDRDHLAKPNEVEIYADMHNVKVLYYPSKKEELNNFISEIINTAKPDKNTVGVSASFGRIVALDVLRLFPNGILNIHPSILPQYRNVAPVPYAIALGDKETGVTVFHMDEQIDKGSTLAQTREPILSTDTSPILLNKLFMKGAKLLIDCLRGSKGKIIETPIIPEPLIFTKKLTRSSGFVEWPILLRLIDNEPILSSDTENPLISLRLTTHPDRTKNILQDLIAALDGWERVWTIAKSKKGSLQVSILKGVDSQYNVLIAGKPNPISWSDFQKYYLGL